MFRLLTWLVVAVLVVSVLRSVIGVVMKFLSKVFGAPPAPASKTAQNRRRPDVPMGGELKKDPVCGTFIAAATSLQKRVGGELYYFCSADCRDKFKG